MKTFISLTTILLLIYGCESPVSETNTENDFSIFLTKNIEDNSPANIPLNKIVLEEEPIITIKSIEFYTWANHKITFSDEAKDGLKLKEPLFGRYFIVTVQNDKIYWGLFTDGASSSGCNNPVIMIWSRSVLDTSFISNSFIIHRAYPEYIGNENDKDLRNDSRLYNVLSINNKLK